MNLRELVSIEKENESIFIFARPFILSFLPQLLIGLALVVFGAIFVTFVAMAFPTIIANDFQFNVFVIMASAYFLLIIPFFTVLFIDYYYDLLVVTDKRLLDVDQNSLFSRNISELALEQVEDVSANNSGVLRTLFDFGDITVQSAGAKEQFVFKGILHPREITEIILDLADQAKVRIERGTTQAMPSGPIKGVIENRVYTTIDPLIEMGAIIPRPPAAQPNPVAMNGAPQPVSPPVASSPPPAAPADDLDIVIDNPEK